MHETSHEHVGRLDEQAAATPPMPEAAGDAASPVISAFESHRGRDEQKLKGIEDVLRDMAEGKVPSAMVDERLITVFRAAVYIVSEPQRTDALAAVALACLDYHHQVLARRAALLIADQQVRDELLAKIAESVEH